MFDTQVDRLVELGYPELAGLSDAEFRDRLEPLRAAAAAYDDARVGDAQVRDGHRPYVLVVTRDLVAPEDTVPRLRLIGPRGPGSKPGVVDRNHAPGDLATYHPIEETGVAELRHDGAYLLVDVERGEEFCGVAPQDALPVIRSRGRSPLTIDEGIALVTQAPQLLERNKCFMLSGSRRDDRRVPALWISQNAPKLGWCWDGNPHSWLGVASAARRVGPGEDSRVVDSDR